VPKSDANGIRVTITLREEVYKEIKHISRRQGLRPATWISMVATTRANGIDAKLKEEV
jgi:predicted DNA-binding ribbon-helix-helix protein